MNIVSFSLYGNNPIYTVGVIQNAKLMPTIYPGWKMFVYHGIEVDSGIIQILQSLGCVTKVMPHIYGTTPAPLINTSIDKFGNNTSIFGKFWRFQAIAEPGAERVIFRDCDSRINVREHAAVVAWIQSGLILHTMKDHQNHGHYQILAGMWGIRGGAVDIMGALARYSFSGVWYDDQIFLEGYVWPVVKHSWLGHGRYDWQGTPFPAHSAFAGFIGQRINQFGTPMHD
jgi:hypothetical protein